MELLNSIRRLKLYLERVRLSTWLTFCFIAFALGTTIGFEIGKGTWILFIVFLFLCFLVFLFFWNQRLLKFVFLILFFFLTGGIRAVSALPVEHIDSWSTFGGHVSTFPSRVSESTFQYRVSVVDSSLKIAVESSRRAQYGDQVQVNCRVVSLEDSEGFRFWQLRAQGVEAECSRDAFLELTGKKAYKLLAVLAMVKNTSRELLEQALPEPESSLALGILLGERGERKSALNSAMRRVGLSHISVVSGYNVLIVAQGVFFLFFFFKLKRFYAFLGSVFVLVFFTLFIGFDASIIRAVIMFVALQIVYFLGRSRLGFYVICLTSFIMLLFNPFLIRSLGFLLSFASVAGMSLTSGFWDEVCKKIPDFVKPFAVSTLSAQSGALPIVMWYFGTVSMFSLLVNIIVLPLIPIAMAASFATVIFSLAGVWFAGWISYPLLTTVVHVAEWFSSIPFTRIAVQGQGARIVMLVCLMLVYIMIAQRHRLVTLLKARFQKSEPILKTEEGKEVVIE